MSHNCYYVVGGKGSWTLKKILSRCESTSPCIIIVKTQPLHILLFQVPDDIIVAVEESKKSGDHSAIHQILNNGKINLRSRIEEEEGKQRTILKKLLDDAVNGDKIVERQLDKNVEQIGASENSLEHGTQIDFEGIFKDGSPRQTRVVKELLDMRASSTEGEQRDAYTRSPHPVCHPQLAITFL